jgi:TldD protein
MQSELDRSKSRLKMDNVAPPYYIEYRLDDEDEYTAEAAFGALRQQQRTHGRSIRVVVRVGDYKQDSYYNQGTGFANVAPVDDAQVPLERALWLATDIAYKRASEALASKKAVLSQYTQDQPFDDFAHAPPLEVLDPLVKLELDPKPWNSALEKATALFRDDPKIDSLAASFNARAINQYFVNTEGTVTRRGYTVFLLNLSGATQAADGMRIERSPYYSAAVLSELPNEEHLLADTRKMLGTLKALREAPVVEEEYRGPVLFSSDAADDVFASLIGSNVLGRRPKPGASARTEGPFASSYKIRVLPAFVSIIDDPSIKTFEGKTLIGSYDTDDEGVRAVAVPVIQEGQLANYLLGREPIRDFPDSNGHGRAGPAQPPVPSIGNLIVKSKQAASPAELKQQLIELCRGAGRSYGYYVETLGPGLSPRLLYRIYEKDGHQEIVRGAVFSELDVRTLRNDLIALGNDPLVSNREGPIPSTVIAPSILFDELEVKRTDAKNAKLPEYPPPPLP